MHVEEEDGSYIEIVNKADLLIAQLTRSISLIYKPLLFITTCFGFTLGNVWTVVINAAILVTYGGNVHSGQGLAWAFAVSSALLIYVPIYFVYKSRIKRQKSLLVKVQNVKRVNKRFWKFRHQRCYCGN
jgi:hypothetical protein